MKIIDNWSNQKYNNSQLLQVCFQQHLSLLYGLGKQSQHGPNTR